MDTVDLYVIFHALGSDKRVRVLSWLREPAAHFPPQLDGDLVEDGVCVVNIAAKLGVSAPTATSHLQVLARAGLVKSKRMKQWTFYTRDETAIAALRQRIGAEL
jgi:DNA-binding transcriptional ArsR family regulator